eukprot:gb/GEZN01020454.1/.p2 GENE.gb/GEZN01020454.1/~~gb/GEZN01020454.1/.p2  ORF type:complete len:116 (+),score=45.54 gb/GEZN01020454.1/:74-421(+)
MSTSLSEEDPKKKKKRKLAVVGGKLNLKGGLPSKKKKKEKQVAKEDSEKKVTPKMDADIDLRTPAEKQFEEVQKRNREKIIEKKLEKSHRERIKDFNTHLASLTEHNDIPRVGPG